MPLKKKTDSINTAYDKIADGVVYGNLGVFVGAGLSKAVMSYEGESIAFSWHELLEKCAETLQINFKKLFEPGRSYPEIASALCKIIATQKDLAPEAAIMLLKQTIADLTSLYPASQARTEFKVYFDALNPKWIITTNYDTIIESILTGTGHSLEPKDQLSAPSGMTPVFHLHGIRTNPGSIVITQEDYVALFRPNEYRLQRLPLAIKESVTLFVGYGLGDFNVLTALDWSKNVLGGSDPNCPNEMIQLVRKKRPRAKPYQRNGIWIVEYLELSQCLTEISDHVKKRKARALRSVKKLKELEKKYAKPTKRMINDFIEDDEIRQGILSHLKESKHAYINGFLELLSRALDQVWKEARKTDQFQEYNTYLKILLDILDTIEVNSVPPALMQSIAFGLDKVGYYTGLARGDAHAAYRTWLRRGRKLPSSTIKELTNISKSNPNYFYVHKLLQQLK